MLLLPQHGQQLTLPTHSCLSPPRTISEPLLLLSLKVPSSPCCHGLPPPPTPFRVPFLQPSHPLGSSERCGVRGSLTSETDSPLGAQPCLFLGLALRSRAGKRATDEGSPGILGLEVTQCGELNSNWGGPDHPGAHPREQAATLKYLEPQMLTNKGCFDGRGK